MNPEPSFDLELYLRVLRRRVWLLLIPIVLLTAILGGILHGIDTDPDLPLPIDDPKAEQAPPLGHDWFDAVERFAASGHAAEVFGETYRHVFAAVKNDEVQTLTGLITPVEYRYYLSRL